jgi:outer membrane beta-barrel protein
MKAFLLYFVFLSFNIFSGTKDIYNFKWLDPKKKVYVLQNKVNTNKNSVYLNLGYGFSNQSDFQDSNFYQAQLGYFFSEEWGIELFYNSYNNENNSTYNSVFNSVGGGTPRVPYIVRVNNAYGGLLTFSPFYGKINTFNLIYYINWSFGVGYTSFDTSNNYDAWVNNSSTDYFTDRKRSGFVAKTQVRWFLDDWLTVNLDYTGYWFKDREPTEQATEDYRNFSDFLFSIGFAM